MDPFSDGYTAAAACERIECPHSPFTANRAWWLWHCGNVIGHQVFCAQLEFIVANFPQD